MLQSTLKTMVRVISIKDGWALVQFSNKKVRYLIQSRVPEHLMEVFNEERRTKS